MYVCNLYVYVVYASPVWRSEKNWWFELIKLVLCFMCGHQQLHSWDWVGRDLSMNEMRNNVCFHSGFKSSCCKTVLTSNVPGHSEATSNMSDFLWSFLIGPEGIRHSPCNTLLYNCPDFSWVLHPPPNPGNHHWIHDPPLLLPNASKCRITV